jgi:hypothetical protein
VSGPSHGTLTPNPNGTFSYTPAPNFNGTDSFTYKANDGQPNSNVATATITVSPVNDAPVAANDSYGATRNCPLTISASGVLTDDTDANGDSLTASLVSGPAHGSVTLNADSSFTDTPAAGPRPLQPLGLRGPCLGLVLQALSRRRRGRGRRRPVWE